MAYYALLDENNIVTDVISGKDEGNFDWEQQYGSLRGQLIIHIQEHIVLVKHLLEKIMLEQVIRMTQQRMLLFHQNLHIHLGH